MALAARRAALEPAVRQYKLICAVAALALCSGYPPIIGQAICLPYPKWDAATRNLTGEIRAP